MTDTTRDLIQRLADELYNYECLTSRRPPDYIPAPSPVLDEARALLSQPEPEGPTEEELEEFALKHGGGYFNCDCQAEADILTRKHVSNYRAVLARWGRPAIQPKPEIVPRDQRPGRRNPFVSDFHEIKPERVEVIPTDYALAYSALARRVAAIDALLRTQQWPEQLVCEETDAAMATIQQVETLQFTISTP